MIRKLVGLMFICFASMAFFAACNGLDETPCESNLDCVGDDQCIEGSCLQTCEDDSDCSVAGDTCEAHPDTDQMVCQPGAEECTMDTDCGAEEVCYNDPDASATCQSLCEDRDECAAGETCRERDDSDAEDTICLGPPAECSANEECPVGWICNEDDVCEDTDDEQDSYYTVLVQDETQGDRCNDETYGFRTSGATVMDVNLRDSAGNILLHAEAADFIPGTFGDDGDLANFGDPWLTFDGEAPDYEGVCPAEETFDRGDGGTQTSTFHPDAVVALGCEGQLYLQFLEEDADGNWNLVEIEDGHQIEVREYGLFCSADFEDEHDGGHEPQTADDPYSVWLCTDRTDSSIDVDTCDVSLGEGQGIFTFDVVLFGEE